MKYPSQEEVNLQNKTSCIQILKCSTITEKRNISEFSICIVWKQLGETFGNIPTVVTKITPSFHK